MAARETAPSIVQRVGFCLGTHVNSDQVVLWCPSLGFAACYQIWPRAANCVLDNVGQKQSEEQADKEPKNRNVRLMYAWPENNGPNDQQNQRADSSKEDVLQRRYPLDEGVGILSRAIIQAEHLVDRLKEECGLEIVSTSKCGP
jgi:hypothetical protein